MRLSALTVKQGQDHGLQVRAALLIPSPSPDTPLGSRGAS